MNKNIGVLSAFCCLVFVSTLLHYSWYFMGRVILKEEGNATKQLTCLQPSPNYYFSDFQPLLNINCSGLILQDVTEIERVKGEIATWRSSKTNDQLRMMVQNCSWMKKYLSGNYYSSTLEEEFPLAFTMIVHNNPEQILRLLRVLYRRQNSFCIHSDAKYPFKDLFQSLADCFDNIVVPPDLGSVVWGHGSILEAQVKCMKELVSLRRREQNYNWKYLLNVCGKELPLATNREMVEKLMKLNNTSNIVAIRILPEKEEYYSRILYPVTLDKTRNKIVVDKTSRLPDTPFNKSNYYKSTGYHALSFPFIHHISSNNTAISILNFFYKCKNPEEHFYATLFMMDGTPGGYNHQLRPAYFYTISVMWTSLHECKRKSIHSVCIAGADNLSKIVAQYTGRFFHNKYLIEYDHSVMYCMEEMLMARNWKEYVKDCVS